MSVSHEQKKEIIDHTYKSACCRRSLLCGIMFAKGQILNKEVVLTLEKKEYGEFAAKLVKEFYGKDCVISRPESGGRKVDVIFDSPSATKFISKIENTDGLDDFSVCDVITQKCSSCLSSFLRGVFLAGGRLSDPKKQFSLEFTLGTRTGMFRKILSDLDMSPLVTNKKNGEVLYFRRGEEIEAFYGHAGLNRVVFDIIETKIKMLARRESQRYLNCVTSNYDRMTAVSERQIGIISKLDELKVLSSLPDELEETARLKLRYPDLPLSALAAQMTPAISKSGLSHRLKKIEEVGAKLLKLTDEK
ncbi:MAG: DNA-binding protein WhiA [Clostridia bacterium]|nr:DNA-binding protein WhiA [Clostridia bacterium]